MQKKSYSTAPIEQRANRQVLLDYADSGAVPQSLMESLQDLPIEVSRTKLVSPDNTVYETSFAQIMAAVPNAKVADLRRFARTLRTAGVAKFLFPGNGKEGQRPNRILWAYLPRVIWDYTGLRPAAAPTATPAPTPKPTKAKKPTKAPQAPPSPQTPQAPAEAKKQPRDSYDTIDGVDMAALEQFRDTSPEHAEALRVVLEIPVKTVAKVFLTYHINSIADFRESVGLNMASQVINILSQARVAYRKGGALNWVHNPKLVCKKIFNLAPSVSETTEKILEALDAVKHVFLQIKDVPPGRLPAHPTQLKTMFDNLYQLLWQLSLQPESPELRAKLVDKFANMPRTLFRSAYRPGEQAYAEVRDALHQLSLSLSE